MRSLSRRIRTVLEMIRFSHSVFALPFALIGMLMAARGFPDWLTVIWIVLACVFARSAAMAFNRLADHAYDARNPRTKSRALPAGILTRRFVWAFTLICVFGFVVCAAMLNLLCLALSPLALAILFGYSYTKRFTQWSHLFLGLALSVAPVGAWIAVRGSLDWPPLLLAVGVLLWVAGFDIIYACQDYEHDLQTPLFSIPKQIGIRRALALSAILHAGAFLAFAGIYFSGLLGAFYLGGALGSGVLMLAEHLLVRPEDLRRVNTAFFTVNGVISIGLFAAGTLDYLTGFAPVG